MSFVVTRVQGDTYPIIVNIRKGNSPFDLTGSSVSLSVARNIPVANGDPVYTMNATSLVDSKATFVVSSEIANLAPGDYWAEMQITDINSYVWTPLQFQWKIKPQIA